MTAHGRFEISPTDVFTYLLRTFLKHMCGRFYDIRADVKTSVVREKNKVREDVFFFFTDVFWLHITDVLKSSVRTFLMSARMFQ